MGIEIRLPNITGYTEKEQLAQIKSYLYQFAQQMQFALDSLEASSGASVGGNNAALSTDALTAFNALKPFIIRSNDIVNAYCDKISTRMDEKYSLEDMNDHIRAGLLYHTDEDIPVYGIEVGETQKIDGEEVFKKYARFTADRTSFYDSEGEEAAYIIDEEMYINKPLKVKSINGVRMLTKGVSESAELDIKSMFADFSGEGNARQTFFIFGNANNTLVYGAAKIADNGTTQWEGTDGVTLQTKPEGILTVVLPDISNDIFTVISGNDFSLDALGYI